MQSGYRQNMTYSADAVCAARTIFELAFVTYGHSVSYLAVPSAQNRNKPGTYLFPYIRISGIEGSDNSILFHSIYV